MDDPNTQPRQTILKNNQDRSPQWMTWTDNPDRQPPRQTSLKDNLDARPGMKIQTNYPLKQKSGWTTLTENQSYCYV